MSESVRPHTVTPASHREFARVLGGAASAARAVRLRGGGTKLAWGAAAKFPPGSAAKLPANGAARTRAMQLSTARLTASAFTATTATFGAGTPLASAHARLARRGRLLAIDPPLGHGAGATLGGVLATADSGPLSHGYGGVREQVLDLVAALTDGSLLRASEYADGDLASLMVGAYGTLGAILEVTVRTHPLPDRTVTVLGTAGDGATLAAATRAITERYETAVTVGRDGPAVVALDYAWHEGSGGLLVMPDASSDEDELTSLRELMTDAGLQDVNVRLDGDGLWARQRAGQRSLDRALLRVNCSPNGLPMLLEVADRAGATVVGRAARSSAYLTINVNEIATIRAALPDAFHTCVTDLPATARGAVTAWDPAGDATLDLMRAIKQRFDPPAACNPGVFIGGI